MNESDIKYMTEAMCSELAMLISKDFNMSVAESLDSLYNSETYEKLSNPLTGLYFQGTLYVYSFLKNELIYGKFA